LSDTDAPVVRRLLGAADFDEPDLPVPDFDFDFDEPEDFVEADDFDEADARVRRVDSPEGGLPLPALVVPAMSGSLALILTTCGARSISLRSPDGKQPGLSHAAYAQ
jgi:hypothetical protein